MACYIMKALTLNREWFQFEMSDLPTTFNTSEFVLLDKPNTPRLLLKTIRRGDRDTMLFEGDIIRMNNCNWLVCYERGFYVINSDYVVRYLNSLSEYEVIGDTLTHTSPVPINFREKHLFKYKDTIFRLNDITGAYGGKLLLRSVSGPVSVEDVNQECCLTHNGSRVFLGDKIGKSTVVLKYGRVVLKEKGKNIYRDIATGGVLEC